MAKKKWGRKKITEIIVGLESAQNKASEILTQLEQKSSEINSKADEAKQSAVSAVASGENVKNVAANIEEIRNEISELKNEIAELKTTAEQLVQTSKTLADESKDQLAIIAGGSLSNTFEKRRGALGSSAEKWFRWLLADIVILVIVAVIVFTELKSSQGMTTNFFLKFSLSFPFIYTAFFFHGQYRREKELEEEYAFKSAVSFSMDAYRKLLKEEIDEEKSEERIRLLDFITDTIKRLYTPPRREIVSRTRKLGSQSPDAVDGLKDLLETIRQLTGK